MHQMDTDLLRYHNLESILSAKYHSMDILCGCHLLAPHIRGAGNMTPQCAKKVVSNTPGVVDFGIGLVIVVLNLPNGQELFFWEIQITEGL